MSDIKRKAVSKKDEIKECYFFIQSLENITPNIKLAMWKYCSFRFGQRTCGRFTSKSAEKLLNELLVIVTSKTLKDVVINECKVYENELLYQIKRAIYFGATKTLYYDSTQQLDLSYFKDSLDVPKRIQKDSLNKDEVEDYFKGLVSY